MALIFDCETYRIGNAAEFLDPILPEPVKADGRLTDSAKIEADIAKKAEAEASRVTRETQEHLDACSLNPYLARLVAIGWAWEGDDVATVRLIPTEAQEPAVLREFWDLVVDSTTGHVMPMIGFNSRAFDLPLLLIRSMLLGVKAPPLNLDRWRSPHPDVMRELSLNEAFKFPRGQGSMRWFAKRFGFDMSDAFSGAEVAQLVESQNWDAIRSHCEWDVLTCKRLAERLGVIKARPMVAA